MGHLTFIHGIANKPPQDQLLEIWLQNLATDGGLDLAADGVTVSMVYWADVLYDQPLPAEEALEALGTGQEIPELRGTPPPPVDSGHPRAKFRTLATRHRQISARATTSLGPG